MLITGTMLLQPSDVYLFISVRNDRLRLLGLLVSAVDLALNSQNGNERSAWVIVYVQKLKDLKKGIYFS